MHLLKKCALMALTATAAVQAAEDPKEPATPLLAPGAETATSTSPDAAADEKARDQAQKDKDARLAFEIRQARAKGYKPQTRKDGTTVYCRNEAPLGSRLEQERCSTLEAMRETTQKSQDMGKQLFDHGETNIKYYKTQ